MSVVDHIVIGAATLDEGASYIETRLGVRPPVGGHHEAMSTHNLLMRLGNAYLEVIAIDPAANPPGHARWFGLDDAKTRARLAHAPALLTWVAGVRDIEGTVASCCYDVGAPRPMSRGDLTWQIALRNNGALARGGLAPVLIEWPAGPHPALQMADFGCTLEKIELFTDQLDALRNDLKSVGADMLATITELPQGQNQGLRATIATPKGLVILD